MAARFLDLLFTPAVKRVQEAMGSRRLYARHEQPVAPAPDRLGEAEREFIAARDSFYLATVTESGWPYVQHRGGPPGFVKVLDEGTLALADYRGNRQYVTLGNLAGSARVCLFFMDYAARRRLKLLGHMRAVDLAQEPALAEAVRDPAYPAQVERALRIEVEGFDWNCPQHIVPRWTQAQIEAAVESEVERRVALRLAGPGAP